MTTKNVFFFISSFALVLIVTLAAVYNIQNKQEESPLPLITSYLNSENVAVEILSTTENNILYFSGLGYVHLPLFATTSASGVRLISPDIELEVWNKGTELMVLYRNDVVFVGSSTGKPIIDDQVYQLSIPDVADALRDYTWRWQPGDVSDDMKDGYTVAFNSGVLSGTTPCGTFAGTYELIAPKLTITVDASTVPTCVDNDTNAKSLDFIEILRSATTVAVTESLDIILYTNNSLTEHRLSIQLDELL